MVRFLEDFLLVHKEAGNQKFWFRGHASSSFELVASLGRKYRYGGRNDYQFDRKTERDLIHRFRRRSYAFLGRCLPAGEAIYLARHHGLPTRLLDWTSNPILACYFMCKEQQEADGVVWGMARRPKAVDLDSTAIARIEKEEDLIEYLSGGPNRGPRVKILLPLFNTPRLVSQDGVFTVQSDHTVPLNELANCDFESEDLDIGLLVRWQFSAEGKRSILRELSAIGVTERAVFPDLDGLSASLWQTEVLWGDCTSS